MQKSIFAKMSPFQLVRCVGVFLLLAVSIVESARLTCVVPKGDQQRCGGVSASLSRQICENLGCCYNDFGSNATVACYKKGFMHLGNLLGYEDRRRFCQGNPKWRRKPCFAQKVEKFTCLWFDCCWDQTSKTCYEPIVHSCIKNGNESNQLAEFCLVINEAGAACGSPPEAPDRGHGPIISSQTIRPPYAPSTTATYSCEPGYVLLPPRGELTCEGSSESWKPESAFCEDPTCYMESNAASAFQFTIPSTCRRYQASITMKKGSPLVIYATRKHRNIFLDFDFCEVHEGKTISGPVVGRLTAISGPVLIYNSISVYLDCKTSHSTSIELAVLAYTPTNCRATRVSAFPARIAPPPGNSGNYIGPALCRWKVSSRGQRSFRFAFTNFNIRERQDAFYIVTNGAEQPIIQLSGNLGNFTTSITGGTLQVYFISPYPGIAPPFSAVVMEDSICFTRQNTSSAVPLTIPPSCKKFQSVITLDEAPPLVVYNAENHEASFVDGDFCEIRDGNTEGGRRIGRLDAQSGPVVVHSSRSVFFDCTTINSGPLPMAVVSYKPSKCGTTYIKTFPATIQPPASSSGNYSGNTLCQWILASEVQTNFTFDFTSLYTRYREDPLYIVSDDPNQPAVRLGGKLGTFSQTIRGTILHVYFVSPFLGVSAPFKAVINRDPACFTDFNGTSSQTLTIPSVCERFQSAITLTSAPPLVIYGARNHQELFIDGDFCEIREGTSVSGPIIGRIDAKSGPVVSYSSGSVYINCRTVNSGVIELKTIAYNPSTCGTTYVKTFPSTFGPPSDGYGNYRGMTLCHWVLSARQQCRFRLNFKSFITRPREDALYISSNDPSQPAMRVGGDLNSFSRSVRGNVLQLFFISRLPGNTSPFLATAIEDCEA